MFKLFLGTLALSSLVVACSGGAPAPAAPAPDASAAASAAVEPAAPASAAPSASAAVVEPAKAPAAPPSVVGGWKTACTPMSDKQGFSLDFDIQAANWAVDYAVFADKDCKTKFFTVRIEGPYALGGASAAGAGIFDGKFSFAKKSVTPHNDAAAKFLASAEGCNTAGFKSGTAKDISESGCAKLGQRPLKDCGADFDLVKVEGDVLTFGERPADQDMCTEAKRPKALSKLSMKKK
jgi:hypothetical protein